MESATLYQVTKNDFSRLEKLLTRCFADDPLYKTLIPDEQMRRDLLPKLFDCDLTEFFETCEIYADSPDLNSLLVVSDEAEDYNIFKYYMSELHALLKTDTYLILEDPSMKIFRNFMLGKDYLNSRWTDQLHQKNRLHIIYLAVDPQMQHHGMADRLLTEVIAYAQKHRMMISLETHNEKNVGMYEHFGFKVFGVLERHFGLKQYCLIREVQ